MALIRDLSVSGALLLTRERLQVGEVIRLSLYLSEDMTDVRPAAALDRSRELMFVWLKPNLVPTATGADAAAATPTTAAPVPAKPAAQKAAPTAPGASQAKASTSTQAKAPASNQPKAPVKTVPATGASHP